MEEPNASALGSTGRDDRTAALETIQAALARMERADPGQVAASQLRSLERILLHAWQQAPFYRERLAPIFASGEIDLAGWSAVPILTREDIRDHGEALRARQVPQGTGIREGETSGSTGTPLKFAWSTLTSVSTRAVVERMAEWHGLDPTATVAEIRSFPDGSAEFPGRRMPRSWSFRGAGASYYRLVVTTPVSEQLRWLRMIAPRYLLTYPTMARELALAAGAEGYRLDLDAILTVGEVLTDEIRDLARDAFGARVIDSYGCQEMGKVAIQCEVSGHYHAYTSNVLVEVLDEAGRQVAPGEMGRIVLTSLYNYAMPFVRYEVGDYGRLGGRCPCGRSLPLLTEILGRRRNMITLPDGNRLWLPGKSLAALAAHLPMQRMRLVQRELDRFELLYVPGKSDAEPDEAALNACAARLIHPRTRIKAVAVEALPRSAGGKYEDVIGLA